DFTRLSVEFKEKRSRAIGMWIACREKFDDERFAGFDVYRDFFAGFQAEEKRRRRKHADIGIVLLEFVVLEEDFRIEQVTQQVVAIDGVADALFEVTTLFVEIGRRHARARTPFDRPRSPPH